MKNIEFKQLFIQNFLSIGKDPVTITFKKGLHIITGENKDKEDSRNGVGKSTIIDAIFFVLFGDTLRPLVKDSIVNSTNKKNCKVVIEFEIVDGVETTKYKIERSIAPSKLFLYINDVDKSRTMPKTTEAINRIIQTTPEMMKNIAVMELNSTEPFLAQKGVPKKKFIEGIFNLSIFSDMMKVIKNDYSATKKDHDTELAKMHEIQITMDNTLAKQKEYEIRKVKGIQELTDRRDKYAAEIEQLKLQLIEIDPNKAKEYQDQILLLSTEKNKCLFEVKKIESLIGSINYEQSTAKAKIKELTNLGNACTQCKRPYDQNEIDNRQQLIDDCNKQIQQFEDTKKSHRIEITAHEDNASKYEAGIKKIGTLINQLEISKTKNDGVKKQIAQTTSWLKQTEQDLEKYQNEDNSFNKLIDEQMERFKVLNAKVEEYKKQLKVYDIGKLVSSEEGIKSFIVKKMLVLLNTRLAHYLKALDANCFCTFNEYFEESIINERGLPYSYYNFSNGERKRIDLAMLFTFMDIRRMQSTISMNIAFYDELLDSSIDTKGTIDVIDVLKKQINDFNKAIYIVSHKNEAVNHADGDIIYLIKENGITRRLEDGIKI